MSREISRPMYSVSLSHLARPTDKTTIDYRVHIGKILSGSIVDGIENDDQEIDKGELMDKTMNSLGMSEEELNINTNRSALSTARQIIGSKHPGDDVIYANVEKDHIQAVVRKCSSFLLHGLSSFDLEYVWLMHPSEKRTNDFAKISKAMGNVFASRAFAKKTRNAGKSSKETAPSEGRCA